MQNHKNNILVVILTAVLLDLACPTAGQEKIYPNRFPLRDIQLLDGPFKRARDLNLETLSKYNVDRLLSPYRKEAGLTPKEPGYSNWSGLDGHVGGHYLSALAINCASTGNAKCGRSLEYMLSELMLCQQANAQNHPGWGKGYLGGVPNSDSLWPALKKGDFTIYWKTWVPWYNVHKMLAGLRDVWIYTGNDTARKMFLSFCDWAIDLTSGLSEEQMQSMLNMEHGGINESLADAYQLSGDKKYLAAAKRFSHRKLLDPMAQGIDVLDNLHANTQIPKIIGFDRIGELSGEEKYIRAAGFFWETVTQQRSLTFGGNSRREHFPSAANCMDYINDVEGPETCNSYNMLKLTDDLFRHKPLAGYIDYYERTLYNHILASQDPATGGYVYFTPARPRSYRVYSKPDQDMWCCVGTGMEDHGKYQELIYTHRGDSLFLNLFIASTLDWKQRGIKLRQETTFPFEERTSVRITKGDGRFNLMIRYPSWITHGKLTISVNGQPVAIMEHPSSYIRIDRRWKKGDRVDIGLPMHNSIEQLPHVPAYIALLHGPILLAAKTGQQDLKGLYADGGRWGQVASGKRLPLDEAPIIRVDSLVQIVRSLTPVKDKPLHFSLPNNEVANATDLELEPFYKIHGSRYMMYWLTLDSTHYSSYRDSLAAAGGSFSYNLSTNGPITQIRLLRAAL